MTQNNSREFFVEPERRHLRDGFKKRSKKNKVTDDTKSELSDDMNLDLFGGALPSVDETLNDISLLAAIPPAQDISDRISENRTIVADPKPKYPRELTVKQLSINSLLPQGKFLIYRANSGALEIYGGCGSNYKFPVLNTNVQENLFELENSIGKTVGLNPGLSPANLSSINNATDSGLEPLLELYSHNVLGDASFYVREGILTIDGEHPVYRLLHAKIMRQASEILKQWLNNISAHGSLDCSCEKVTLKVRKLDSKSRKLWSKLGYDNTVPKNFAYVSPGTAA